MTRNQRVQGPESKVQDPLTNWLQILKCNIARKSFFLTSTFIFCTLHSYFT